MQSVLDVTVHLFPTTTELSSEHCEQVMHGPLSMFEEYVFPGMHGLHSITVFDEISEPQSGVGSKPFRHTGQSRQVDLPPALNTVYCVTSHSLVT